MKNSKLHTTEDKSNEKVTSSNSKSEDTPHNCQHKDVYTSEHGYMACRNCGKKVTPEPPQDTSLDEIFDNHGQTIGYGDYYQTETLADIKIEIMAWHKAERAKACKQARKKLFEQIRSEVIGEDKPDNSFDEDYINGWNNCLAEQREALTRLEKNEKVTE